MTKRSIAIVGSRTYPLPKVVWDSLDLVQKAEAAKMGRMFVSDFVDKLTPDQNVVISGGAQGVDTWAAEFAEARGITVVVMRANWKKYGAGAGFKRNGEIVLGADDVVAFWDGQSKGTLDTIRKAHNAKKPYAIIGPDNTAKLLVSEDMHLAAMSSTKETA